MCCTCCSGSSPAAGGSRTTSSGRVSNLMRGDRGHMSFVVPSLSTPFRSRSDHSFPPGLAQFAYRTPAEQGCLACFQVMRSLLARARISVLSEWLWGGTVTRGALFCGGRWMSHRQRRPRPRAAADLCERRAGSSSNMGTARIRALIPTPRQPRPNNERKDKPRPIPIMNKKINPAPTSHPRA
jgi:hypothetical protein